MCLALDCQATAANPARGHLLEIGWSDVRAKATSSPVETKLFQLPEGAEVPQARSSGHGHRRGGARRWTRRRSKCGPNVVADGAHRSRRETTSRRCTTVIHFSRFEEPYLALARGARRCTSFPLAIVCTHEIVRRLLPALPRRGLQSGRRLLWPFRLRAQARLAARHGDHRLGVARRDHAPRSERRRPHARRPRCMASGAEIARTKNARAYPMHPDKRRHLPDRPGVYRMLRAEW